MHLKITLLFFLLVSCCTSAENPELYLHHKEDQKGAEIAFQIAPHWFLRAGTSFQENTKSLSLPVSMLYKVPGNIAIWRFYGGVGASWGRESELLSPFVVGGTEFLFLYSEYLFSLEKNSEPTFRGGFHFKF